MTTIGEKQATIRDLIDDHITAALSLDVWTDADTDLALTNSSNDYTDHARAIEHNSSGTYLMMYVTDPGNREVESLGSGTSYAGVRTVVSNDWDSANNVPTGNTNVISREPFSSNVGTKRDNAYDNTDIAGPDAATGLVPYGKTGENRLTTASRTVTYFGSVRDDGINIAAWNTSDSTYGSASHFFWEHVTDKFWQDGFEPIAYGDEDNISGDTNRHVAYAFRAFSSNGFYNAEPGNIGLSFNAITFADWGFINPEASDDTFFFRRPIIYGTNENDGTTNPPIAFLEDTIPNRPSGGGAHGDTITLSNTDYRVLDKQGASISNAEVTSAHRFE